MLCFLTCLLKKNQVFKGAEIFRFNLNGIVRNFDLT